MEEHNLSLTKLDEGQNHDDFIVVWLSEDDAPNSIVNFADYLKKYHLFQTCLDDIKQLKSERKILLVLTMNFGDISIFENLPQIQSIYILKEQDKNVEFNKQNHSKLLDVFHNIDDLIDRLRKDILLTYRSDLPISISSLNENNIEQSLTNLHGNSLTLLWNQYFIYYLINNPSANMEILKKNMIGQCRLEYQNNEIELNKIEKFATTCSDKNILQWYTKDSFLYRLLNKAFRTRNIDFICQFQYYLISLYKKFQELSETQSEVYPLTIYRGQIINANDLER